VGIFQYETAITFPEQLTMLLSGKGPNDTVVDDQGNILADKYVKLTGLQVDGLDCPQEYLEMFIVLDTDDGQKVASNYFGFNGLVTLDFLEENSFFWSTNVTKQILKK
jgi:hypothetical protein